MKHLTIIFRIFTVLLSTFISVSNIQAQTVITHNMSTGSLSIPGNSTDNYIITGTTTTNTVTIGSGYRGSVTLDNVSITSSKTGVTNGMSTDVSCITVLGENNRDNMNPLTRVTFILKGTNQLLYTGNDYCGIQVNQGAQILIKAVDPNDDSSGKLIARCTAPASSSGGGGAAIGAPNFKSGNSGQGSSTISCNSGSPSTTATAGGNVLIASGSVVAQGGHAAGIGGGWYTYYNGVIIVYGGIVDVSSGRHAAGIGSGCPTGKGVIECYAPNSAIIALPPASITGYGKVNETDPNNPDLALAGAKNITYMNDRNKTEITVHTSDYEPNADIYIDLTETPGLTDIFTKLGIDYDLKKVKVGTTDASGLLKFNAQFEQNTTFFTDASSSQAASLGRPYMPVKTTVIGNQGDKKEIILPILDMGIAFTDYPSTPLEVGYTTTQARENAHMIKMEFKDPDKMQDVTFKLQGDIDFKTIIFLDKDKNTMATPPTELNSGDVYYILLPIETGKPIGIYSDVLLINGKWKNIPLPGYIRRISEQRVVKNDTGINNNIKVTAFPNMFVALHPATKTAALTLNIDHTGTGLNYNPLDVKAKYLITTEADYDTVLAANPLSTWSDLKIPAANLQNEVTTVTFSDKPVGDYYIHWYVLSGVVYAHSQTVTNPPLLYGGFGPYIVTTPVVTGNITGNPTVCSGQVPNEIKGQASSGGSGDFTYQWQMSTNGTTWTSVGGNTVNYTPAILSESPTHYRRITIDNKHGGNYYSNTFTINVVTDGLTLYWNKNSVDNNWNNPQNWTDALGTVLNIVPVSCTNVYIPGGLSIYPSLDPISTPDNIFGSPQCNNITFEYGAELAYQHKLTYTKAHVQYNWGYYGNLSGISYGSQPTANASMSGIAMLRDKWYALSAPLKGMATGDFAFAGRPLTWQAGFALSDPQTGVKAGNVEVGDFSKKFSTNDVPLSETNNAIAVKVASYQNTTGYKDHSNLEGLKGIIEIPYFENQAKSIYYPGHAYDKFTKESKFFYFNPQTLQLIYSPVGQMKRGSEAYRFVYEESGVVPNIDVAGASSVVPGYKQKVKKQSATSSKVMIGNPFLASINAKSFFDANIGKLLESDGYQLYNSQDGTWKYYSFAALNSIPPYQSFIVTITGDEVDLLFPLEGTYALTGTQSVTGSSTGLKSGSLYLKSTSSTGLEGDYSVLSSSQTAEINANVKKMISSEGYATPETFFIGTDGNDYNLVQAYQSGINEIAIGVKCSDTKDILTLTFENADKFSAASNLYPVLLDKYLGIRQNLTVNNTYEFTQRQTAPENNFIDANRFALQLYSSDDLLELEKGSDISISYINKQIEVISNQNIVQVQIYDVLGRQIYSVVDLKTSYYTKSLPLSQGVYVVKVYREDGVSKVGKIMVL